ncbi:hypothetical protein ACPA9J_15980 [Pseudomonas aeruginosa]
MRWAERIIDRGDIVRIYKLPRGTDPFTITAALFKGAQSRFSDAHAANCLACQRTQGKARRCLKPVRVETRSSSAMRYAESLAVA